MKRFRFQLESVLDFKQQRLDSLMVELGAAQDRVRRQNDIRDRAYRRLADYDAEYAQRKAEGLTVVEAMEFESGTQVLERKAKREDQELARLQKLAEHKRLQVVEARKETYTLEKLRELKRVEYNKEAQKAEERMIDDLTATRRVLNHAV